MKTKINYLKTGLLAIAVFCSAQIFAQVYPTAPSFIDTPDDLNVGKVVFNGTETFTVVTDTPGNHADENVGFYKPVAGASVTAVTMDASLTDAGGVTFDSFNWYEVSYNGTVETENLVTNTVAPINTNTFTDLEPGYHKFRVRGVVGGATCPSTEYEDMIVFVLPRLNVVPTAAGTSLTYCEGDVPTGADAITVSATIEADYTGNANAYPKPGDIDATTDFALVYNWFAIPASAPGSPISLGNTATIDLSTLATPLAPDTYTFYLDVEYDATIRDKQTRTYVTYGGSATATSQQVIVTATPGTPTITVTGVSD